MVEIKKTLFIQIDPQKVLQRDEGEYNFLLSLNDIYSADFFNEYPLKIELIYIPYAYAEIINE